MSLTWQQMCDAAPGLTPRMLDHWTRRGWIHADNPHCGSGRARRWPDHAAGYVAAMIRLVHAGLHPEAASRAARGQPLADGIRVVVEPATAARPVGHVQELLAAGPVHAYTVRDGRAILDGFDVTDEYPIVQVAS